MNEDAYIDFDRFKAPEVGPEDHPIDWGRTCLDHKEYLHDRLIRREEALRRAEQAIDAGEVPELEGVAAELEKRL